MPIAPKISFAPTREKVLIRSNSPCAENILLSIENENNENNNNTIKDKMSQNTDLINNKVLIKIADFGSACKPNDLLKKQYIQSMFYRAPEVIIGLRLNEKVDVWSIGCILVELYLSTPILPGTCSYDQLYKINTLIGEFPQYLIECCQKKMKYFHTSFNLLFFYSLMT